MNCAIVLVLAFRYPSSLFRPSFLPADTFDVFLCYNRADTLNVRAIARELASRRIRFFLDEHESAPGQVWTDHVRRAIDSSPSFCVFVGAAGIGQWQAIEIQNIVEARLQRGGNIIPVFLPDAPQGVRPPMQLAGLTWVDFRRSDPDPMAELIRGVQQRRPILRHRHERRRFEDLDASRPVSSANCMVRLASSLGELSGVRGTADDHPHDDYVPRAATL